MKLRTLTILMGILSISNSSGQEFKGFLDHLNSLPVKQRQAVTDEFLRNLPHIPWTENDTTVHFFFSGEATRVLLAGDESNWQPLLPFTTISGTTFWFLTRHFDPVARLDYKIVVNDTSWILDPLNAETCMSGYGPNSTFHMPQYQDPPELEPDPSIPHGTIHERRITSDILGYERTIRIYLPAGYENTSGSFPVVLFHDGGEFLDLVNGKNILDYLIGHRKIRPLIGIFVPPVHREKEYTGHAKDQYRRFIVEELMPTVDSAYRTSRNPQDRAMTGISNGGNIGLYIAIKNPEQFGKVAAMSSNYEPELFRDYAGRKANLELYLDMGLYDIPAIIGMVERFTATLDGLGYFYRFYWYPEGHSWGNWEGHLRVPLMQFFPLN